MQTQADSTSCSILLEFACFQQVSSVFALMSVMTHPGPPRKPGWLRVTSKGSTRRPHFPPVSPPISPGTPQFAPKFRGRSRLEQGPRPRDPGMFGGPKPEFPRVPRDSPEFPGVARSCPEFGPLSRPGLGTGMVLAVFLIILLSPTQHPLPRTAPAYGTKQFGHILLFSVIFAVSALL